MKLREHILSLEGDLLKPEVRGSIEKTCELLVDGFKEFCSSGQVYIHREGESVDSGLERVGGDAVEEKPQMEIVDFDIQPLSEECILATYKVIKHHKREGKYSLRSSIWKRYGDGWKMFFHQGTPIKEVEERS